MTIAPAARHWHGGSTMPTPSTCRAPDCDRPAVALGLCASHHHRDWVARGRGVAPELTPIAQYRRGPQGRLSLRLPLAALEALRRAQAAQGLSAADLVCAALHRHLSDF